MWLPILSTALYGLTLTLRGGTEEKEAADWWNQRGWQAVILLVAGVGAYLSIRAGFVGEEVGASSVITTTKDHLYEAALAVPHF
jgi:hypothetical protein